MAQAESLPATAEHFEDLRQQTHAAHLGMWLFLTSEVLLFGALFGMYTAYRAEYPEEFARAAHHNALAIGTVNTLVLITSSLCAAWAVHSVQHDRTRTAARSLLATCLLGLVFLGLKSVEYAEHFRAGIFPGRSYHFAELPSAGANLFFTLYYLLTGLHALHVIGGLSALAVVIVVLRRGGYTSARHTSLELAVLYWHLVDVIWIFLWPLLYLVG